VKAVFADTFYFLAILNPRDRYHARAQGLSGPRPLRIVTTRAVLLEVADALADPSTRGIAAEIIRALEVDPNV
jgi:predicted nucleic acid-binding protein